MLEKTRWYQRHAFGSPWDKNVCKLSFGYTHSYKKISAASNIAVMAATSSDTSEQTITSGLTDPDAPRALVVKPGGTSTDVGSGVVTITGTNVEGKTIAEDFSLTDGSITAITGNEAFMTVTEVYLPPMDGTNATVSVGTSDKIGMNHRLFANNTTVKVVTDTGSTRSLESNAPTVVADGYYIEENVVTPDTSPDGTYFYTFYYIYDEWSLNDTNDDPVYVTATSTSTSTSSTSTSTSTTSTSTSSTSTSTTSTSISTSSTSTSTTTVP